MDPKTTTETVPAVARRLKLLQVEMRNIDAEARAELLHEQVAAILDEIPLTARAGFLRELSRHFPVLDGGAAPQAAPAQPSGGGSTDPAEGFLQLAPETQAAVIEDLMNRGLVKRPARPAAERAPAPRPTGTGGGGANTEMFCKFLRNVAPFFLRTMENLSIRTDGLVEADILEKLEAALAGDCADADAEETEEMLDRLAISISSLITVIPHLGRYCTQSLAQKLAAERIEDLSHNEGKAVLERWDAVYWKKYKEMSAAFSDGTLEKDINTNVASHVDKWLQRARKNVRRKGVE